MKFHPILLLLPLPLINIIYGFSVGLNIIALSQVSIICTSILYWTNLDNFALRILDILIVKTGIIIHFFHCYTYVCLYPALLMCCCVLTYLIGKYYDSNLIHSFVWIFGYVSNFYFISSYAELM